MARQCSAFAGPYTVTHHKSTLLIGGLFSFYNAGSGTNQSNHRYKLGPTHEGKLERGCKTGSFAYMMWPCRVGPFSVVLGKHTRSFDTADLPFSHLEADSSGRCELIPGHYIATVGTLRDGAKWPKRDRRSGPELRDVLCFDVFNPLTVGRMVAGAALWPDFRNPQNAALPRLMSAEWISSACCCEWARSDIPAPSSVICWNKYFSAWSKSSKDLRAS